MVVPEKSNDPCKMIVSALTLPSAWRISHSARDCVLLCSFHHQIAIHRWGWTLVLNPDSTTTAWNKEKTKVLHSHGPPVRPG
jgi:hypothetical protein